MTDTKFSKPAAIVIVGTEGASPQMFIDPEALAALKAEGRKTANLHLDEDIMALTLQRNSLGEQLSGFARAWPGGLDEVEAAILNRNQRIAELEAALWDRNRHIAELETGNFGEARAEPEPSFQKDTQPADRRVRGQSPVREFASLVEALADGIEAAFQMVNDLGIEGAAADAVEDAYTSWMTSDWSNDDEDVAYTDSAPESAPETLSEPMQQAPESRTFSLHIVEEALSNLGVNPLGWVFRSSATDAWRFSPSKPDVFGAQVELQAVYGIDVLTALAAENTKLREKLAQPEAGTETEKPETFLDPFLAEPADSSVGVTGAGEAHRGPFLTHPDIGACQVNPVWSGVCNLGTKGCNVDHPAIAWLYEWSTGFTLSRRHIDLDSSEGREFFYQGTIEIPLFSGLQLARFLSRK